MIGRMICNGKPVSMCEGMFYNIEKNKLFAL